jgi:hypothetical protein
MANDAHERYVDAAAATLGLHIPATEREAVLRFFGLAASMAELVMAQPLAPADESGNIFVPVAPTRDEG